MKSKIIFLLLLIFTVSCSKKGFLLEEKEITIKQADFENALYEDENGYPRINWEKYDRNDFTVIDRTYKAVILENRYVTLTILPEMGRIYSLVFKPTGHEELWQADVARPIGGLNDTGWWFVIGGIEYVIPRGEHGTTFALPWRYSILENSSACKKIKMTVTEPRLELQENLVISMFPDKIYFKTDIEIKNRGSEDVRFSHWINPMWAPGGRGEITDNTEFIIPSDSIIVANKNFNKWMYEYGEKVQPYHNNPMRFMRNWKNRGDILVQKLNDGFYSAYSHDTGEGIVRVFDKDITPGVDIWTWGFNSSEKDWKIYSFTPNKGYVEIWGGITMDYGDSSLKLIRKGEVMSWSEYMYPCYGTRGLKYANEAAAVNLTLDSTGKKLYLAVYPAAIYEKSLVKLVTGEKILFETETNLNPDKPFVMEDLFIDLAKNGYITFLIIHDGQSILEFRELIRYLVSNDFASAFNSDN